MTLTTSASYVVIGDRGGEYLELPRVPMVAVHGWGNVPVVPGYGLSAARRHEIALEDEWLRAERQRAAYELTGWHVERVGIFRRLVDWFASCLAP
jgi:hypothetical protein